jgi:hypothetical protein
MISRFLLMGALLAPAFLFGADSEPHMKTKLCNPAETSCTDVTNSSAHVNLRDSAGTETGITSNPLITTVTLSYAPELLAGRLYATSAVINAASSGVDNPLMLFRNPLDSGKNYFVYKIVVGISVANVAGVFKLFGQPTLNNTVTNITNITQTSLSTTVTVTTSTNHNATVGATATIDGTVNFNGAWTVASVTSATIYTFTKSAVLITTTETTGTSTVNSSLGTGIGEYPLKRVASPTAATGLASTTPTVSSNGEQLIVVSQGQNSASPLLMDEAQLSLEPGQNILVTGDPSSNNRATSVSIIWSEVAQ